MIKWTLETTEKFKIAYKKYGKKRPDELEAVITNLKQYHTALNKLNNPLKITAGYIHPEPKGIVAIDQKGKSNTKLQQTRLYIYCIAEGKVIKLLTIGDKNTQKDDINYCKKIVDKLKGGK